MGGLPAQTVSTVLLVVFRAQADNRTPVAASRAPLARTLVMEAVPVHHALLGLQIWMQTQAPCVRRVALDFSLVRCLLFVKNVSLAGQILMRLRLRNAKSVSQARSQLLQRLPARDASLAKLMLTWILLPSAVSVKLARTRRLRRSTVLRVHLDTQIST